MYPKEIQLVRDIQGAHKVLDTFVFVLSTQSGGANKIGARLKMRF
jgi:hypothetical protein